MDFLYIYNEKTFQKILEIDLHKLIKEYENKNQENQLKLKNNDKKKLKLV